MSPSRISAGAAPSPGLTGRGACRPAAAPPPPRGWRAPGGFVRALAAAPRRVPAAVARARPRLISVRAEAATGDQQVEVLAVVEDGRRRYVVPLRVREAG